MLTNKKVEENKVRSISMCNSCELEYNCSMSHQDGNLYACDEYRQAEIKEKNVDYREEIKTVESLGLCATCNEKTRCSQKSLPGGVWHCEEYQ